MTTLFNFLGRFTIKPIIALIGLYCLAYAFITVNGGIFWDDWTLIDVEPQAIIQDFIDYGIPQQGILLAFISSLPNAVFISHSIIFGAGLGVIILLYVIVSKIPLLQPDRFFLAAIAAVFPVNFARISIATLPYAVSLLLFFLAWFLATAHAQSWKRRGIILCLFFLSFSLNSLLVFYALFLWWLALQTHGRTVPVLKWIVKNIDYVLLPVLYWLLQKTLWPLQGSYVDYNTITLEKIMQIPYRLVDTFISSLWQPMVEAIANQTIGAYSIVILAAALVLRRTNGESIKSTAKRYYYIGGLGLIMIFLGAVPYLLAGHQLTLFEWTSRHQILIPFGASFILTTLIRLLFKRVKRPVVEKYIFAMTIGFFIALNSHVYFTFLQDWIKQESLMNNFLNSDQINSGRTFVFDDRTRHYDAIKRTYRFYEYSGMFQKVFHDGTRLGMNSLDRISIDDIAPYTVSERYHLTAYRSIQPVYRVIINPGDVQLTSKRVLSLTFLYWLAPDQFRRTVPHILKLKTEIITPADL